MREYTWNELKNISQIQAHADHVSGQMSDMDYIYVLWMQKEALTDEIDKLNKHNKILLALSIAQVLLIIIYTIIRYVTA